jgi:hypothetical protein
MGRAQPRLLVRVTRPRRQEWGERGLKARRRFPVDGAVVPGLLLLVARDLAAYDPPRVLAWRLLHDSGLAAASSWLGAWLPAPSGAIDRDPIAQALAGVAAFLALAYGVLAATGARARVRAATLAIAATVLVVLPSLAFVAMGAAAHRPYGQDGGVVQLPLALDRILEGSSPYAADYSNTILARQARVSSFWDERGGNPILHHHAYLPGTHLVMMPFHLASRTLLGFFDPRTVTLLFYVLSIFLAARLPAGPDTRLAAAGVAAVNPLAYWHQIFGANDVVFVAMLLGVVLLLRSERRLAAGALLGLACATKQLAWPFAPFLLLWGSGARSLGELLSPGPWKRLARPAAAAAAVFLVVVTPVAALDFHAFWSDIVAYNVGLSGGDNYPLGGTPGFGVGNFLIYFGRVASLRDYFPFSVFYLLLVPLGFLLARAQVRFPRVEWALVTGSAALLASVYFSRVAHPNYVLAAAILLPVGVMASGRQTALALAPLLLVALAVEIVENGVFQTVWEQASAAGYPTRIGGLAAVLAPRAGPHLTHDPLGLLFGAVAAGAALVFLLAVLGDVGRRVRLLVLGTAFFLTAVVPTAVLVWVGGRTGVIRAQDPWVVQAQADARRLLALRSPLTPPPPDAPIGREALSSSFRLDPPAEIQPDRPLLPPAVSEAAAVLRLVGARDPRWLALAALSLLGLVVAVTATTGGTSGPLLGLALTLPPLALGTTLGSPWAFSVCGLAISWALLRQDRPAPAGLFAGVAAACDPLAVFPALAIVLAGPAEAGPRWDPEPPVSPWRRLLPALGTYALLIAPVALLDPAAFAARVLAPREIGAGLGIFNLLAYRGLESTVTASLLAAVAPLAALAATLALARPVIPAAIRAGLAALAAIVLAPSVMPDAVAVPIVLLGLAAADPKGEV